MTRARRRISMAAPKVKPITDFVGNDRAASPLLRKPVMDVDKVFGKKTIPDIKKGLRDLNVEYVKVGFLANVNIPAMPRHAIIAA